MAIGWPPGLTPCKSISSDCRNVWSAACRSKIAPIGSTFGGGIAVGVGMAVGIGVE